MMNKQIFCFLFSILLFGAAQAQSKYTVTGKLTGLKEPSKIFLQYRSGGEWVDDSAIIKNGNFTFKGTVDRPVKATLIIRPLNDDGPLTYEKQRALDKLEFYLEKAAVSIKGDDLKTATVKGGKTQKEYLVLQSQLKPYQVKMEPLSEKMMQYFKEKNEAAQKELFPSLNAIAKDMDKIQDDFLAKYPDSYVTFDIINSKAVVIDPQKFEPFYNLLSARLRNTKEGKLLGEQLEIAKKTSVGNPAMDFSQKSVEGEVISLSSLRGKYILLDFWASWCGPCRAENPNVLKAYNQFKDKNFDVLAVSLDEDRDAWLKAIKEDGMPWIHVSDLKGFENAAAVQYGIRAIPQNFLIDPSGKIIATNLRGEKLEKTLTEMIKN